MSAQVAFDKGGQSADEHEQKILELSAKVGQLVLYAKKIMMAGSRISARSSEEAGYINANDSDQSDSFAFPLQERSVQDVSFTLVVSSESGIHKKYNVILLRHLACPCPVLSETSL